MQQTVVYVNPTAGGGHAHRAWQDLLRAEPGLAQCAGVVMDSHLEAAEQRLDSFFEGGVERLLVVGGDGTLHRVVNRLLDADLGQRVTVGLIPAGTGSDLARSLGLPRRSRAALARVLGATPRSVDVLRIETDDGHRRHVANIASLGVTGAVAARLATLPTKGAFAYVGGALSALRGYEPPTWRILADGKLFHEGPLFALAVANGRAFGNGLRIAPHAELDDGLADVVLIEPLPLWQLPWRFAQLFAGRHLHLPYVRSLRATHLRVEPCGRSPSAGEPFEMDGETLPAGPAEIVVVPKALRFLA